MIKLGSVLQLCLSRLMIRSRHRQQVLRTCHNVRVTFLCGLLTLVVLRSYLGAGKFGTPLQDYHQIRHHLHSFKLRHLQHKLLLRRSDQLTQTAAVLLRKDTLRSTLSFPSQESFRSGEPLEVRNPAHIDAALPLSSSSYRPQILLVTGSHSCWSAIEAQFLFRMLKNKIDYCLMHGIAVFSDAEASGTSTSRLRLLQELMLSHPQVEWIWWMDSLAMFTDMSSHIAFERYTGYDAVVHARGDREGVQHSCKDGRVVAWDTVWEEGSFLMRNSDSSRNFLASAGRRTEAMQVFMERTGMERNIAGGVGGSEGEAWPLVMHFGQRCGLCGRGNTDRSCVTDVERALDYAERSGKKKMGST